MYQVQVVRRNEVMLHLVDGVVVEMTPEQKLAHHISGGETMLLKTEEVVEHWRVKSKTEANARFWRYITENSLLYHDHFLVYTK